jgi:hypothetical protein
MARSLEGIFAIALAVFAVWTLLRLSSCAIDDGRRRGEPALLVWIAVLAFFPWGLIAWLLFRPEAAPPASDTLRSRSPDTPRR